ncbi:MAG: phosphoenolpyruvate--protein phosphotransferase [Pseudomonadota bacterium]
MTMKVDEGAPRRLLRRLRDVMASSGKAQQRLDKVVNIISADIVAEVCSVYLLRAGEVLELFASKGLKREAVHVTRLRVGEGLVGQVAATAKPLNLADAQTHPHFAYRPETGEEIYHSFLGVPILHDGRVVGVLVVQNKTRRLYSEIEIELLQTIAMVLAELVAGGELVSREELFQVEGNVVLPIRLGGVMLSPGLAMGQAVLHRPRIELHELVAEDPERERVRFEEALDKFHSTLDELITAADIVIGGKHKDILESYRMFARDRGWLGRINEAIVSGLTAAAAVQKVQEETRVRMEAIVDPIIRENLYDLDDLANRLIQYLTGHDNKMPSADLPADVVLIARNMGPAELLDYDSKKLRALVLEEGSPTSHVAIIARTLDIPVLARVKGVLEKIDHLEPVIVDCDNTQVFIRPGEDVQQTFAESLRALAERRALYAAIRHKPTVTTDGVPVSLNLNAGLLIDLRHLEESGADGIGLYRTEILFMVRPSFPGVEEQTEIYSRILDQAGDKPVTFRTLDIGGDKQLPYFSVGSDSEENPAMGWRALRIALDRPQLLRQQARALLRAAAGRRLRIMFPMVAEVMEYVAARKLLEMEVSRERQRGEKLPDTIEVGVMLEVPALFWQLPTLLPQIDFLSVGSNDLFQFFFASDRGSPRLANRYDSLSPAVLRFLHTLVQQCQAANMPVALCGEMAGHPLDAMALLGLGFRNLSMSSGAIGPVKTAALSLHLANFSGYLETLYNLPDHSVRDKLRAYALDRGVAV